MLNPQQKKAIETTTGRVLILAGAGSGKTSVITHRIAHLIKNLNTSPKTILGLTFTNKAAQEMRKRVAEMVDSKLAQDVMLCTFHSFCMQVLRKEIHHLGYTKNFSLYDERDMRRLIQQLARLLLQHEGELPSLEGTFEAIAKARNQAEEVQGDRLTKELYDRLQTAMRAYNAVDFDSLLSLTLQLFEKFPAVLKKYQDQFRYLMIDEYQDTNQVQYKIASLLAATHHNLCVVGDDDQAIYSWRGADVRNILRFESQTVIKLEQNYRSTEVILQAANHVIRHNTERHGKELWSAQKQGEPITIFHAPTEADEVQAVIHRAIKLHQKNHIPWSEIAILYRSNILSRNFEIALMQACWERQGEWVRGIPYQVFGGTEFTERAEIKDLTAYLRAMLNPYDQEAILRIINVPRRGISDQALDILTQTNRSQSKPLWEVLKTASSDMGLSDRALTGVRTFVRLLETAREKLAHPPYAPTLKGLIEEIDYQKAIAEDVKSDKMRAFKWENVGAYLESLSHFEGDLQDFIDTMTLDNHAWSSRNSHQREEKLNLMTFHSAKGLEFTACFLVGLEDSIMPHEKSLSEGGLEEERRLMYVAMTRAKKHLFLSMARRRKRYGKESNSNPSRFLFEIPKDLFRVVPWADV
jgi:DNA helicase-2/ATP-dependent DNA helicase PcrA